MATVNGWYAGGGGGVSGSGRWVFSQWGRWGKTSVQMFYNHFLIILTEGAVTTEAGSLYLGTGLSHTTQPASKVWSFGVLTLPFFPFDRK